jgi:hypothetical protein
MGGHRELRRIMGRSEPVFCIKLSRLFRSHHLHVLLGTSHARLFKQSSLQKSHICAQLPSTYSLPPQEGAIANAAHASRVPSA